MIQSDSVIGNIKSDSALKQKYEDMQRRKFVEVIKISRLESSRIRMRKTTDKGTDVALTLPPGTTLRNGDVVILTEDKMVVVAREPENLAVVEIKGNLHGHDIVELAAIVGHKIGNLHRPIMLEGHKIYFPIQAESELEMLNNLFVSIRNHLEIGRAVMIFEPAEETDVHEH